jgi:hypothetical protein
MEAMPILLKHLRHLPGVRGQRKLSTRDEALRLGTCVLLHDIKAEVTQDVIRLPRGLAAAEVVWSEGMPRQVLERQPDDRLGRILLAVVEQFVAGRWAKGMGDARI